MEGFLPTPANRQAVMGAAWTGISYVVAGLFLRNGGYSLPWTDESPLTIGSAVNVVAVGLAAAAILIILLDQLSAPGGESSYHKSAVAWLNLAGSLKTPAGQPDRPAILLKAAFTALGQEAVFRGAIPSVVPGAGGIDGILGWNVPTGLLVATVAYCYVHDDTLATFAGVAGTVFAGATFFGGVAAAFLANLVVGVGASSLYFHALHQKVKKEREQAKKKDKKSAKK